MRHFCGDIEKVHCFAMKAPGRNIWSTASINMKFKNGIVGHLTSSYDIERGHPMERCEVAGTKGRLVIEDMWREATLYPAKSGKTSIYQSGIRLPRVRRHLPPTHPRLCRQVADGTPEQIDGSGADGLGAESDTGCHCISGYRKGSRGGLSVIPQYSNDNGSGFYMKPIFY